MQLNISEITDEPCGCYGCVTQRKSCIHNHKKTQDILKDLIYDAVPHQIIREVDGTVVIDARPESEK